MEEVKIEPIKQEDFSCKHYIPKEDITTKREWLLQVTIYQKKYNLMSYYYRGS